MIEVDRTVEFEKTDPNVTVTMDDGYMVRFHVIGLSDREYIRRAEEIKRLKNKK